MLCCPLPFPAQVHRVHTRLPLRCVALGDGGTFVISYEDGDLTWSAGLSNGLIKVLRATHKYKRELCTISLGRNEGSGSYAVPDDPGEVWFARRNTGVTYLGMSASADLREAWDTGEGDDFITHVFFAPSQGYFELTEGGGASWSDLPASLGAELEESWDHEGSVESRPRVHPTLNMLLKEWSDVTGELEWAELGPNGTFVALFERYTAWYGSESLTHSLLECM